MSKSSIAVIPQLLRAKEDISTLTSYQQSITAASLPRSNKRPVGQLCHRTRSYRSFKLPRRLKQGLKCKKKKLRLQSMPAEKRCRKYRRRRLLLLETYGHIDTHQLLSAKSSTTIEKNAVTKVMCLSTHLWHRKRFVMANRHGIATALRSSQRGLKALQHYTLESCKIQHLPKKNDSSTKPSKPIVSKKKECAMLQDVSYLRPLQLTCSRAKAIDVFTPLLDPMAALHHALLHNKYFQAREFVTLLYEPNCFPKALIGPVTVCLKESEINTIDKNAEEGQKLQIILWCEPSIVQQIHQAITASISNLEGNSHGIVFDVFAAPVSRFDLMGANKVQRILHSLFQQYRHQLPPQDQPEHNQDFFMQAIRSQAVLNNVWRDGQVLCLHMRDPRLPVTGVAQNQPVDDEQKKRQALKWPRSADMSPLWTANKDTSFGCTKHDTVFAKRKQDRDSHWSVITSQLANVLEEQPVDISALLSTNDTSSTSESFPLMLIRHRPSTNPANMTERCLPGWSLVVPESWSRSVWDRFTHAGFLPVGVEELDYMRQRHGVLSFPQDFPDTLAGRQHWNAKRVAHSSLQLRKPPSKRSKLDKYSALCAVFYDPQQSAAATSQNIDFTVVRTLAYLTAFNLPESNIALDKEQLESILGNKDGNQLSSTVLEALPELPSTTFVHLLLNPTSRGLPRVGAIIYAMTAVDLQSYATQQCKHKLALQGHANFTKDESKWPGIACTVGQETRTVLGVVTSGYVERINRHKHEHSGRGGAIAMSNVEDLHKYMRSHYELFGFPDAHKLVLFHNPGSEWLRPAKIHFM